MNSRLRKRLLKTSQQFVPDGEQVTSVFSASTRCTLWLLPGVLFGFIGAVIFLAINRFRMIMVTDQRILVLECSPWNQFKAVKVLREIPRATRIGAPSGLAWSCRTLGEKLWVDRAHHAAVAAADAALAA